MADDILYTYDNHIVEHGIDLLQWAPVDITGTKPVFGTARPMIGSVNLDLSANDNSQDYRIDNELVTTKYSTLLYTGTLDLYQLDNQFKMYAMGYVQMRNGGFKYTGYRRPFAIQYITKITDDMGIENYKLHVYYYCFVGNDNRGAESDDDSVNAFKYQLPIKAVDNSALGLAFDFDLLQTPSNFDIFNWARQGQLILPDTMPPLRPSIIGKIVIGSDLIGVLDDET